MTTPRYAVDAATGCWNWAGAISSEGYARLGDGYAHRAFYERAHGAIPAGLQIDHLCRNRRCVNPQHLEAVTQRENILRGDSPCARNAEVTHCPLGHPYEGENLRVTPRGGRKCKACHRLAMRKRHSEQRAVELGEFHASLGLGNPADLEGVALRDLARPVQVGDWAIPETKTSPRVVTNVVLGQYVMTRGVGTGRSTRISWRCLNRYRFVEAPQPVPRQIPNSRRAA